MADKRIQATENMIGANHPSLTDTLNRLTLVEHNTDGTHNLVHATNIEVGDATQTVPQGVALQVDKSAVCDGTITTTAGSGAVVGVATSFLNDFQRGDTITCGGETRTIQTISSATTLTTDNWAGAFVGQPYTAVAATRVQITKAGVIRVGKSNTQNNCIGVTESYTDVAANSSITGVSSSITQSATTTTGARTSFVRAGQFVASVGASNTQNWTQGAPAVIGLAAVSTSTTGATGIVSYSAAIQATASNAAAGLTITNQIGIQVIVSNVGPVTNAMGLTIPSLAGATNNTLLLMGTAATPTPVTGNWGIYNANTYTNFFAGIIQTPVVQPSKTVSVANNFDLVTAELFTHTLVADTTFTVSNVAASGKVSSFILEIINGGAFVPTFWAGVKWPSGAQPVLTTSGKDSIGFYTYDGGTTWTGLLLGKDIK